MTRLHYKYMYLLNVKSAFGAVVKLLGLHVQYLGSNPARGIKFFLMGVEPQPEPPLSKRSDFNSRLNPYPTSNHAMFRILLLVPSTNLVRLSVVNEGRCENRKNDEISVRGNRAQESSGYPVRTDICRLSRLFSCPGSAKLKNFLRRKERVRRLTNGKPSPSIES